MHFNQFVAYSKLTVKVLNQHREHFDCSMVKTISAYTYMGNIFVFRWVASAANTFSSNLEFFTTKNVSSFGALPDWILYLCFEDFICCSKSWLPLFATETTTWHNEQIASFSSLDFLNTGYFFSRSMLNLHLFRDIF